MKGTEHVEAAVSSLEEEGVPLEFELLQGVGHAEVRSALERSAIVVDQLNAGWYGGFAVEAMAIGRPVLAALDRRDHPCLPPGLRRDLPVVDASVETLVERLRRSSPLPTSGGALARRDGRSSSVGTTRARSPVP